VKRSKQVKKIKKLLKGDLFYTSQIIDNSSFVDFCFLDKFEGKEFIWNACATTTKGDYYDIINSDALTEAYEKYPNPVDYTFDQHFQEVEGEFTRWVEPNPELADKRYRYMSERIIEELNKRELKIKSYNIEVDESYKYGIGLHIRLPLEGINTKDITDFIRRFLKYGKDMYKHMSPTKISFDADDIGVYLPEGSEFVRWKDFNPKSSVEIKFYE